MALPADIKGAFFFRTSSK